MTTLFLNNVAAAVLSLILSYLPGAKTWWSRQSPTAKRIVMAILLLFVSVTSFAAGCGGLLEPLNIKILCTEKGFVYLMQLYLGAIAVNQGTFAISGASSKSRKVA